MIQDTEYNKLVLAVQVTIGKSLPVAGTPGSIPVRKVLESLAEQYRDEGRTESPNGTIGMVRQSARANTSRPFLKALKGLIHNYENKSLHQVGTELKSFYEMLKMLPHEQTYDDN